MFYTRVERHPCLAGQGAEPLRVSNRNTPHHPGRRESPGFRLRIFLRFGSLQFSNKSSTTLVAGEHFVHKVSKTASLLELQNVTVMRGDRAALQNVSLRVEDGEHVCILGPNGCGKSTLIKTITRECYPVVREGSEMRILGKDRWDVFELRNLLGIVSPDLLAQCSTDATGRDVVLSGFFSSTRIFPHHHPDPEMLRRADLALQDLDIQHLADRAVAHMSSGEAKRTLIARALVHEPKTLLFDEPSNALDLRAQFQLRDTMRNLARRGLGILLVTHHVSEIIPEMERVVMLQAGRVLADGPKREILTEQNLSRLFGVPVRLADQDGYYAAF